MPMPHRIAVLTASRAEFGLLSHVMREIQRRAELELQVIVTGTHLSEAFGSTIRHVEAAGFPIAATIDMELAGDDPRQLARAAARCTAGVGDALAALSPHMLVVLGDRYETLAAALAATIARVPIAHIAGGDVTLGSFDDALRDAITVLSSVHLVTCEESAVRVRQLGARDIHIVGTLSNDAVLSMPGRRRDELEGHLGWSLRRRNIAVAFHPATRLEKPEHELEALLQALVQLGEDVGIIMTGSNADPAGVRFSERMREWGSGRSNVCHIPSLEQSWWLELLKQCDAVVGNSSSGIYEAPLLKRPAVNVGRRQDGRVQAASTVNTRADSGEILSAIHAAFAMDVSAVRPVYGDMPAAPKIIDAVSAALRSAPSAA